ncbi:MAG: methylmalonyl Co-A mutase-associated GTPase MeaB [Anaeromyxobacter sp.]
MATNGLAARVRAGDVRAAARLMRDLDDRLPGAEAVLRELFPHTGKAWVIGLTGAPGAGKSSLTDRLIAHLRRQGKTVGVIAVDPSSPFTGGAILGDRIRMQEHATDEGVFIRSLGTRGHLGGLSRSTAELVAVMDAMGKDVVLVETVGVGQDEIEIASLAQTTVVVTVPGLGDDVQAIKAGVLEIADVFAVNKADRDGADRTVRDLQVMLELRRQVLGRPLEHDADHRMDGEGEGAPPPGEWEPPIVRTVAVRDQGVDDLVAALERHRDLLASTAEGQRRAVERARAVFVTVLRERLLAGALARLEEEMGRLDAVAARIAAREADPYGLAEELASRLRAHAESR